MYTPVKVLDQIGYSLEARYLTIDVALTSHYPKYRSINTGQMDRYMKINIYIQVDKQSISYRQGLIPVYLYYRVKAR